MPPLASDPASESIVGFALVSIGEVLKTGTIDEETHVPVAGIDSDGLPWFANVSI